LTHAGHRSRLERLPAPRHGIRVGVPGGAVESPEEQIREMAEFVVRPSAKLLKAAYFVSALLAACVAIVAAVERQSDWLYLLAVPVLMGLWAGARHITRRFTRLVVEGGRVRYESGVLSKTTRTMELSKLQDVRVDQSLGQRLLNTGDLSLETAGETSRIVIHNVDRPRQTADRILEAADRGN